MRSSGETSPWSVSIRFSAYVLVQELNDASGEMMADIVSRAVRELYEKEKPKEPEKGVDSGPK